jgi:E3 ubiquitin-protein ligase HECTD1
VLSSGSLPDWCEELTYTSSFLFPFETRQLYFYCTAFGSSRLLILVKFLNVQLKIKCST